MAENENIEYRLKVHIDDASKSMEDLDKVEGKIKKLWDSMSSPQSGMASEPSKELQKFAEDFEKTMDSMRGSKKLDIISQMFGKFTDPNASTQERFKIKEGLKRILSDVEVEFANLERRMKDRGILSDDQIKSVMQNGLGESYGVYSQARQMQKGIDGILPGEGGHQGLRQYAKMAAMYMIGYMISDLVRGGGDLYQAGMMTEAQISQRGATTFDMNSMLSNRVLRSSMHMQNVMQGLELRKQGQTFFGNLGGSLIGAGIGGFLGSLVAPGIGTVAGVGIGSMIGGAIGGEIGGISGTQDITAEMKRQEHEIAKNRFLSQIMGIAEQRVNIFDQLDVTRTKFGARTGLGSLGGAGLGYTDAERYGMGTMQAGLTGRFNENAFVSQLAFSRAFGYSPEEIFRASISERFTNTPVGANELFSRKDLADRTGMGNRFPELVGAINNLALIMTRAGANATEQELMKFGNLPFMLFGDTARGRMGDLGMDTLMGIHGAFQQEPGSAQDAFLFMSTYNIHKGNLLQYSKLKEQGVFGQGNLEAMLQGVEQYRDPERQQWVLQSLRMNPHLAEAIVKKGFNEDGTINHDFIKEFNKLNDSSEGSEDRLAELLEISKENLSGAEKHKEDLVRSMTDTGEKIASAVRQMEETTVNVQNQVLGNQESWDIITREFNQGVREFVDVINKMFEMESGFTGNEEGRLFNLQVGNKSGLDLLRNAPKGSFGLHYQFTSEVDQKKDELYLPIGKTDAGNYAFLKINPEQMGVYIKDKGELEQVTNYIMEQAKNQAGNWISIDAIKEILKQYEKTDMRKNPGGSTEGVRAEFHFHASPANIPDILSRVGKTLEDMVAERAMPSVPDNNYD